MSRQRTQRVLTVASIKRSTSSVNGNPAFWVTFTDGTKARTVTDAGFSYALENPEYRDVPLLVTFAGDRIAYWEVAK